MTTKFTLNYPSNDDLRSTSESQADEPFLLRPPSTFLKAIAPSLIDGCARTRSFLSNSTSNVDRTDDDEEKNSSNMSRSERKTKKSSPSEFRLNLYPDDDIHISNDRIPSPSEISKSSSKKTLRRSDPSLLESKTTKHQTRVENLRTTFFDHPLSRRLHSSFSSSTTLRSLSRHRSGQNFASRHSVNNRTRRTRVVQLSRTSKWRIVQRRLHDIAMMSESYARMKTVEKDLRWMNLREQIRRHVGEIREMNLLQKQDDGLVSKKKNVKTKFNLKTIPLDEVLHVERDGQVYTMSTRDLVLGRLFASEQIQLDKVAQLDARRQFQVQQKLVEQQEGRNRLKKNIAFSFCLCNLSFIVVMCAAMFIFAMKTIFELRSRSSF